MSQALPRANEVDDAVGRVDVQRMIRIEWVRRLGVVREFSRALVETASRDESDEGIVLRLDGNADGAE